METRMMYRNKIILLAAAFVLTCILSVEGDITVSSWNLVAQARENKYSIQQDIENTAALPFMETSMATQGVTTVKTIYDFSAGVNEASFRFDVTHNIGLNYPSCGAALIAEMQFSVSVPIHYRLNAQYATTGPQVTLLKVTLKEDPTGNIIFHNLQQSRNKDETFVLGRKLGNEANELEGLLWGTLPAGNYTLQINESKEGSLLHQASAAGTGFAILTLGGLVPPIVTCQAATNVKATSATLHGTVVDDGGETCEYRFVYEQHNAPNTLVYTPWTCCVNTGNSFSVNISGLTPDTPYDVWAEAKNSIDYYTSDAVSFTTSKILYVDDDALNEPGTGTIDDPFRHIQDAINFAANGDKVIVFQGTYLECVTINNKNVELTSLNPNNPGTVATTIINGQQYGSVVTISDSDMTIDGFTITDGLADMGGGIRCENSQLTIRNMIVTDNQTRHGTDIPGGGDFGEDGGNSGHGGGIYGINSTITFEYCEITGNCTGRGGQGNGGSLSGVSGDGGDSGSGGGMYCSNATIEIYDSNIMNNYTGQGGEGGCGWEVSGKGGESGMGGGICCIHSSVAMHGTLINNNYTGIAGLTSGGSTFRSTPNSGHGGGLYCDDSTTLKITTGLIDNNYTGDGVAISGYNCLGGSDSGSGGGIYSINATIANCTVVNNYTGLAGINPYEEVYGIRGIGGGLLAGANTQIINSIIWGNNPQQISGCNCANVSFCDIADNLCEGLNNNLSIDPLFVDSNNDFHLKSQAGRWNTTAQSWLCDDVTSSCIDAGDPGSSIGWEPYPNGGVINMGCYGGTEYASKSYFGTLPCQQPIAGDTNGDCKVDLTDFAIVSFHWLENNNP